MKQASESVVPLSNSHRRSRYATGQQVPARVVLTHIQDHEKAQRRSCSAPNVAQFATRKRPGSTTMYSHARAVRTSSAVPSLKVVMLRSLSLNAFRIDISLQNWEASVSGGLRLPTTMSMVSTEQVHEHGNAERVYQPNEKTESVRRIKTATRTSSKPACKRTSLLGGGNRRRRETGKQPRSSFSTNGPIQ